jgi:hypothetical protein
LFRCREENVTKRILGLPVYSRRTTVASATALFIFYVMTMCRSLSMYDSPELALVAEQLGLGHPFGQPLHTILGALVSRVPGADPLIALNALSALAGALTVIPATSFAETLVRPGPDCPDGDLRYVAPTIALLGLHPALWEPSTRIEVYPLAVFFAIWAAARFASAVLDRDPGPRPYLATGLALGLSASANLVCALVVALAMMPRLLMGIARQEIPRRALRMLTAGGLLGLVTYAYVFVVAGRTDVVVWGAPTSAKSIAHYFSAADFASKGVASWSEWWEHLRVLFFWSLGNGLFALLLAGFTGYALYARQRGLGRFFFNATLIMFVAFVAHNGVFAPDVLDYNGYLAIPAWLAASGVGLFLAYLGERKASWAPVAFAALLFFVLVAPPAPYQRTRHRDMFTSDIAREALQAAPLDAVLIVERDHWIGPMWYLQEQRAVRQDVTLVAYGLSSSEWFWDHLYRRHPDLEPIELRGSGGRDARVRRFLRANANRPIQIERAALADRLGLPTCPGEWMLDVRSRCGDTAHEPALARYASVALAELQEGSPGTDGLIALVTLDRGHDLYSEGFPRAAIATLLAGVPRLEGFEEISLSSVPARIERTVRPAPAYDPPVALGHPARNLHYASRIAGATGANGLARYLADLSEAMGPVQPKFATLPASPANL